MLAPVFAMRHQDDAGIGDTLAVRQAIDFCADHSLGVLQLLPLHETFADPSPYNAISAFALSPSYIALSAEEVPGLSHEDLEAAAPSAWREQLRTGIVKHSIVHTLKTQVLRIAHHSFKKNQPLRGDFEVFLSKEAAWLRTYCLYRLLLREYEGNPHWPDWRPQHQHPAAAERWLASHPRRTEMEDEMEATAFAQWVAARQWHSVRTHAESQGVLLMGELSFGVGRSSADVWQNPELFDLEWSMGTPPIHYFDTSRDSERWGQNWGFPPYRWENHRATGFEWLRNRVQQESRFFHLCRIDHLRGYFRAYMFPWSAGPKHAEFADLTEQEALARTGGRLPRFIPGPDNDPVSAQLNRIQGRELLSVIRQAAGSMFLVGEIMGQIPPYLRETLEDLQIAKLVFPQLDEDPAIPENSLISYGNHDHAPLATLIPHLHAKAHQEPNAKEAKNLQRLLTFLKWQTLPETLTDELLAALQTALLQSPGRLAILMCSDIFGTPARFNLPGSYGLETWCERLDYTFPEYANHPDYEKLTRRLQKFIQNSRRGPTPGGQSAPPSPQEPSEPQPNAPAPPPGS
jgi:4-alpha-glucanotransferase